MKESSSTLACLIESWLKNQNLKDLQVETEYCTSFRELCENEMAKIDFQLFYDRKTDRPYMVKIPLNEYSRCMEISQNGRSTSVFVIFFILYLITVFGVGVFLSNIEEGNSAIALWVTVSMTFLGFLVARMSVKKEKREELEREKCGLPKKIKYPWYSATKIELNREDYSFLTSLQNNQELYGDENYQLACEAFYNAKTTGSEEALKAVISSVEKVKEKLETDSETEKATN